jgi:lysophospholipase L1-like esterase
MKRVAIVIGFVLAVFLSCRAVVFSSEIRNAKPVGENIICFGDSLTRGFGARAGMDYPSQLAKIINRPVINAGVTGDTTASALTRLEEDVLSRSPRIALITLGANDLMSGVKKEVFSRNLRSIIELIQERGALVIVGGIRVPVQSRGFWNVYERVCRETGALLIPNILEGIWGNPDLMIDLVHPNSAGYTVMAKHFYKALEPYL